MPQYLVLGQLLFLCFTLSDMHVAMQVAYLTCVKNV